METLTITLILAALLLVAALAIYALRLWQGVWKAADTTTKLKADARSDQINSVRVLAKSLLDGDLNLTEAAIRLKVVLDSLHPDGGGEQVYPDVYALYDETAHMPRGMAARKAVEPEKLRQFDEDRETLEQTYHERIYKQAQQILEDYPLAAG